VSPANTSGPAPKAGARDEQYADSTRIAAFDAASAPGGLGVLIGAPVDAMAEPSDVLAPSHGQRPRRAKRTRIPRRRRTRAEGCPRDDHCVGCGVTYRAAENRDDRASGAGDGSAGPATPGRWLLGRTRHRTAGNVVEGAPGQIPGRWLPGRTRHKTAGNVVEGAPGQIPGRWLLGRTRHRTAGRPRSPQRRPAWPAHHALQHS
jgi:hypothetical protein